MAKARVAVTATDNLAKGLAASKKSLNSFEKYVRGVGDKISKTFSIATLATATVAGIKGIEKAMKLCVQEFSEAEKVSKRLEAVWNNVGAATGKTAKEMDDYAESLEKVTYFSAESVKEAGLLLAATESLTEDGFDRALRASADLAAALGEDITAAAQTLSKAIQEPEAALSRLKTIGVSFTEDEKAQIKALAEANKEYEAQSLILSKIEEKYQGVAKAINNTPVGTLDNIGDVLSDIRKDLGGALLDTISPALNQLYKELLAISEWSSKVAADAHRNNILGLALNVGTALNPEYGGPRTSSSLYTDNMNALAQYTTGEIEALLAEVKQLYENTEYKWYSTKKQDTFNQMLGLQAILDARKYTTQFGGSEGTGAKSPVVDKVGEEIDDAVDTLTAFLEKNSKSSSKYMIAEYAKVINEAEGYKSELVEQLRGLLSHGTFGPGGRLENQDQIDELMLNIEVLTQIIDETGSKISDLQLKGMNLTEPRTKQGYSSELEWVNNSSFLDDLGQMISSAIVGNGYGLGGKADVFGTEVVQSFANNMGTAGEVALNLAQNMATMGPALGGLFTALEFVFQGLSEVVGPELERMMTALIEPLVSIGKALGSFILPILQLLTPVLNTIAKVVIVVAGTFQYIGQLLQHWVATIMNWLADLSLLGWHPFGGLRMDDPGSPGSFGSYIQNKLNAFDAASESSVATDTAVSSASYRGATQVTINIYQSGPVVGDGGMREFARMIRDEFDALDYYGVTV